MAGMGEKQKVTDRYQYTDIFGNVVATKIRKEPGFNGKKKHFYFEAPDGVEKVPPLPLYRLNEIVLAQEICLTEGEKDADSLIALGCGFVATCNPYGAGNWHDEYTDNLTDTI